MAEESKLYCDIRASFAIAFRNWRLESNIPVKKIAVDLGVTISTVSLWESGRRFPTASGQKNSSLPDLLG